MDKSNTQFTSGDVRCAAWHHTGEGDGFAGDAGRPCVVMAHGIGGTYDAGLDGFAEALSAAGLDVLGFDYRNFGHSGGEPRQVISPKAQRADYHAAIAHARGLEGVDPERIVLWGVSFSGGHVAQVTPEDGRIAAVIALTPSADNFRAINALTMREGIGHTLRLTAAGVRDVVASLRGNDPVMVPLAGAPGELAAMNGPGHLEGYEAIAGPSWRNEMAGRILLSGPPYRPGRHAAKITCPLLVQVADEDEVVPPEVSMWMAEKGRAEVRHYPGDHFDVYPGRAFFDQVVAHQLAFLRRHLAGVNAS